MNCEELSQAIKMVAQTVNECKTKNELMRVARDMQRGMSGTRTMSCLKKLQAEGKVRTAKKCVQWGKCYYDPPQETFNSIRDRSTDLDRRFQELEKAQLENLKNDFEETLKRLEEANSNDSAKASGKEGMRQKRIRTWSKSRSAILLKEPVPAKLDN